MSVPGLEMHHGLMAARGSGSLLLSIFHLFRWKPAVIAVAAWILFGICTAISAGAAASPLEVRSVRAPCVDPGPTPLGAINRVAGPPPPCDADGTRALATQYIAHQGTVLDPTDDSPGPIVSSWSRGADAFQFIATVATIGAVTVGVLGVAGAYRARRPSRIAAAARKVKREHDRARNDIDRVNRAATKLGQRRLEAHGRRWAKQDAAGQERSELGTVDRLLIGKRVAPPKKPKTKKGGRSSKALAREFDATLDAIEARRSVVPEGPHLDPTAGPPLPPGRSESPQVAAWRRQAADVEARTAGTVRGLVRAAHEGNGYVGYEPPAAPVNVSKEDVS